MRNRTAISTKKAAYIMIAVGILFLFGLFDDINKWEIFCPEPVTVQGVVTDNRQTSTKRGYIYYPEVRFELDGRTYDVRLSSYLDYGSSSPYTVGKQLTFRVNRRDPKKVLSDPGVMTYVFGALTFFMFTFGIIALRSENGGKLFRDKKEDEPVFFMKE